MLTVYRDDSLTMPRTETDEQRQQRLANLKSFTAPDTSGGTVALPAKVPPELKAWVAAHSASSGKSQSQIVREALEMYRASIEADAPPVEQRPR